MSDPVEQEVARWLKSMKRSIRLTTSESELPVTGTRVVKTSEEQATRLREEIPDVLVQPQ
jgi:hypothetical protein